MPVGLIAICLGIAGIIIIERSGGRLTGRVFALLGILIPVVVFCLIFVLLMVLVPAITRVPKGGRTIACRNNLKQWGLIFAMYTDDRNGRFFSRDAESSGCWWMDPLRLYHRD
ncbi:MAG: hypothetical protein ACYTEK_22980, partial [Planctomycetota bacterium]